MRTWAAVDVLGGRVVTLVKGEASKAKDWRMEPDEAAARWEDEGVDGLHVIDLDRALGTGSNVDAIARLVKKAKVPVQVGGGIRTLDAALETLKIGPDRIVLGTMALSEPAILRQVLRRAGDRAVAVALDFKRNTALTHGWKAVGRKGVLATAGWLGRVGVRAIIATAVERDGTARGPDLLAYRRLRPATGAELIASGGIRSTADVKKLRNLGLDGVILGRALYEKTVRLGDVKAN